MAISMNSIEDMCRTCMSAMAKQTTKRNIFEVSNAGNSNTLMMLLFVEPQIQIDLEDGKPKKMCLECIEKLQITYDFLQMYKDAEEKFCKLLKEVYAGTKDFDEPMVLITELGHESDINNLTKTEIETDTMNDNQYEQDTLEFQRDANQKVEPEFEGMLMNYGYGSSLFNDDSIELMDNSLSHSTEEEDSKDEWSLTKSSKQNKSPKKITSRRITKKIATKSKVTKQMKNSKNEELTLPEPNENGSLSCPHCDVELANESFWREHLMDHSSGKIPKKKGRKKGKRQRLECEFCKKAFPTITLYNNHLRTHTGEQPYLCIECGKSFAVNSSLNVHMKRHRGEKKYKCPQCPKAFVCGSGLYGHMRLHEKERPFVCDVCGSAFHFSYMLKTHKRYHTNIKTHPCEYCEKSFYTAEKQRRHMRTHTGEKPYRCKYCDRAYAQSNDCNKHMKQHLGENIFQCEMCPLRFPLVRELRIHFATHKDDNDETRALNLKAREDEEESLRLKFGLKEI